MGAAFGGSSQTIFGSPGAAGFLAKITTFAAVGFMITSLLLAFWSTPKRVDLIPEQPVSEETVPAEDTEIPRELPE
jgi:preprotein translocase subunit SecG